MKKSIFVFAVSLFVFFSQATAQVKWNAGYQAYIDKYKDIAIREMLSYNIPASITLAQGLLESGAGRSDLTNVSVPTTAPSRVLRTIAGFSQQANAINICSSSRIPITKDGPTD